MTDDLPSNGSMSVTEVTGLVQLFNNQLLAMEGRLVAKMDDNSRLASERWVRHDQELEANTRRIVKRFEEIEKSILVIETTLESHLKKEHDEELVVQARVRPVVTVAQYVAKNWRTIALIAALITTGLLAWTETFEHMLTGG